MQNHATGVLHGVSSSPKGKSTDFTIKSQDNLLHSHLSSSSLSQTGPFVAARGTTAWRWRVSWQFGPVLPLFWAPQRKTKVIRLMFPCKSVMLAAPEGSYHSAEAIEKWQSPDVLLISKRYGWCWVLRKLLAEFLLWWWYIQIGRPHWVVQFNVIILAGLHKKDHKVSESSYRFIPFE